MIRVRRMTADDLPQVLEIERICFSEPWSEKVYRATLLLPYADYYVAEVDDRRAGEADAGDRPTVEESTTDDSPAPGKTVIIGTCGVRRIAGCGEITNVAVRPEHRGFGIAGRMLTVLIAEATRKETAEFTLEVRAGNVPAIRTYEKLGFRIEGRRPGFYEAPKEDALIMWRRAHAVTDTEGDTEDGSAETAPAGSDFR